VFQNRRSVKPNPLETDCSRYNTKVSEVLISAGEASGDRYAAWLVEAVRQRNPQINFFGCAGDRLKAAGCEVVVDAASLATVGLSEVLTEIPRIYGHFRHLLKEAEHRRPKLAVLVDSPDFNLRVAKRLKAIGVPVLYLVAPQAWAWRPWRTRQISRLVERLLCIFPFEEPWFRERGVNAEYIGHPLASRIRPATSREEFFTRWNLRPDRPLVALLPGSRRKEIALNLPGMLEAAAHLDAQCAIAVAPGASGQGATPAVTRASGLEPRACREVTGPAVAWDLMAHADVSIVASGTVTVEAALLGAPMVVVYRVTQPTWQLGRLLVRTPFYSMVNLVAGRKVVEELIQDAFTPAAVAAEARRLLASPSARAEQRRELAEVSRLLATDGDPIARAAGRVEEMLRS
jgi:lipid-A-disaccharide synthase